MASLESESINARKGIKTYLYIIRIYKHLASESINARKGIKTYCRTGGETVSSKCVRINKCP